MAGHTRRYQIREQAIDASRCALYRLPMDEEPELAQKRKEFYAAQNHFNLHPDLESREAYKKASAAFNLALHHAGQAALSKGEAEEDLFAEETPGIPADDLALIEEARLAQNAAQRAMYASPGLETRENWKLAKNNYKKVRRQLDPTFRAKLSEATRKSQAKNKA